MTTFASYGEVTPDRQAEIMGELSSDHRDGSPSASEFSDGDVRRIMSVLAKAIDTERRSGATDNSGQPPV